MGHSIEERKIRVVHLNFDPELMRFISAVVVLSMHSRASKIRTSKSHSQKSGLVHRKFDSSAAALKFVPSIKKHLKANGREEKFKLQKC